MKPGIFIQLLIAGLLFISCNHKQSPVETNSGNAAQHNNGNNIIQPPSSDNSISSSWQVNGCAAVAVIENTKSISLEDLKDYNSLHVPGENEIKSEGDSIIYMRYVSHGCCRKVKVNTKINGNVINITEFWWGQICKCMCSSDVSAVIRHLPKGSYHVYAIETGTNPFDDKPTNTRDTLMRQLVTIK